MERQRYLRRRRLPPGMRTTGKSLCPEGFIGAQVEREEGLPRGRISSASACPRMRARLLYVGISKKERRNKGKSRGWGVIKQYRK